MPRKRSRAPREVFLSHSSRNRAFVSRLADLLARHDIPAFFSERHIVGAQEWHDQIGKALRRCDWFLLILSPNSVNSKWVKSELMYALNDDRYRERIVPILFRTCDYNALSWTLSAIQMVDFRGSFDAGCRDLLAIWKKKHVTPQPGRAQSGGRFRK